MADIEVHPFKPFLPLGASLLMLGTFPPAPKRWCMEWYYPNFSNDMWRIVGLLLHADVQHYVDAEKKSYHLPALQADLAQLGVALYDTCYRIRRTTGTASDKDLEVVTPTNLDALLSSLPQLRAVVCAGALATRIFTEHYGVDHRGMQMGEHRPFCFNGRDLRLYRMPSTSRAFPMPTVQKARFYGQMMQEIGMQISSAFALS